MLRNSIGRERSPGLRALVQRWSRVCLPGALGCSLGNGAPGTSSEGGTLSVATGNLTPAAARAPSPAPAFLPDVCATWGHALPNSLAWVIGDFEGVDDHGKASGERMRITEERVWLAEADPSESLTIGTPYFHPSEAAFCIAASQVPAPLRLRWPAQDPGAGVIDVELDLLSDGIFTSVSGGMTLHMKRATAPLAPPVPAPTDLEGALRKGTFQDLERMLAVKADVNAAFEDGPLPLEIASKLGQLRMVQRLLAAGARPNVKGETTPLVAAVDLGDAPLVRALLAAGADPLLPGEYDRLPIVAAATPIVPAVIEPLLAAMPSLDGAGVDQLAFMAIHEGRRDMLQRLLKAGWKVNQDGRSRSVLEVAADAKQWDTFQLLVEAGADTGARVQPYDLPLVLHAAKEGPPELMDALLRAHANVDVRDGRGRTAPWFALENPALLERLIDAGASLDQKDESGENILHFAVRNGAVGAARRLVAAAPQLLAERNMGGQTPLALARDEGNGDLAIVLQGSVNRATQLNAPLIVAAAGIASRGPDGRIAIVRPTMRVEASLGTLFAVEWENPSGVSLSTLLVTVNIEHPPIVGADGTSSILHHTELVRPNTPGERDLYAWSMDKPAELQPGPWRFVVTVFGDPARTQPLFVAERTFDVVLASAAPSSSH